MKKGTILMILLQKFPPDLRVEKEAEALTKEGYEVYVIATEKGGKPTRDHGAKVVYVAGKRNTITKSLLALIKTVPWYEYQILKWLKNHTIKPAIIHVHDLPWAYLGYKIARQFRSTLILDFHENYPAAINVWRKEWFDFGNTVTKFFKNRIIKPIFFNIEKWKKYELEMVKKSDAFIVVVEEALERFPKYLKHKSVIVSNTEKPEDWQYYGGENVNIRDFRILYIGGVEYHRGIHTIVEAMAILKSKGISAKLEIVGAKRGKYTEYLKNFIEKNNLMEVVEIKEWVEFQEIQGYLGKASVCVIPHLRSEHTDTTVPHKLFQYMAAGKAVIVSDAKPLKRIVEETESGVIFKSGNSQDAAEKIEKLFCEKDLLIKYGRNARKAVEGKYNWERDKEKLLELYDSIMKRRSHIT